MKRIITAAAAAAALALTGCAQTGGTEAGSNNTETSNYPTESINLLVAFDSGGSTDVGARLLAKELEKELDVSVTVENRPGAGGQVGYTAIAESKPDGNTMGVTTLPGVVVSAMDDSRQANYKTDSFQPIALQVVDPGGMMVAPNSDIETVDDLVAAAKKNPGEIRAATTGIGTGDHFGLLLLEEAAGIDLQPVHFTGSSSATTAFLGDNNVEVLIGNVSDLSQLVENGTGKLIGMMADDRSPLMPDVPTFKESGYDVVIGSARGYVFPKGVSKEKVQTISKAIGNVMEDKDFQERMKKQGLAPVYMDTKEYQAFWDETVSNIDRLLPLVRKDK